MIENSDSDDIDHVDDEKYEVECVVDKREGQVSFLLHFYFNK